MGFNSAFKGLICHGPSHSVFLDSLCSSAIPDTVTVASILMFKRYGDLGFLALCEGNRWRWYAESALLRDRK